MSGCPVNHGGSAPKSLPEEKPKEAEKPKASGCPVNHEAVAKPAEAEAQQEEKKECPVGHKQRKVYNVYGQLIDPSNNMPANPNQEPAPDQRIPLSKDRVKSNIPKGGTDEDTWLYPSPQMFFNALRRKGKQDGFREESAELVVAIHNNMNEKTWAEVMEWEKEFCAECPSPKLLKFTGRPDDLSPKARLKTWIGWITPFDRHDWYVDRCGKEVRYVIDYYFDEGASNQDQVPALQSKDSIKSIHIDVRPALDSLESISERIKKFPQRMSEALERDKGGSRFTESRQAKVRQAKEEETRETREKFLEVQKRCADRYKALSECKDEVECEKATLGLNYCTAQVVCKDRADRFMSAMEKGADPQETAKAFQDMDACLWDFGRRAGTELRS